MRPAPSERVFELAHKFQAPRLAKSLVRVVDHGKTG
jgi:hypothetical protein